MWHNILLPWPQQLAHYIHKLIYNTYHMPAPPNEYLSLPWLGYAPLASSRDRRVFRVARFRILYDITPVAMWHYEDIVMIRHASRPASSRIETYWFGMPSWVNIDISRCPFHFSIENLSRIGQDDIISLYVDALGNKHVALLIHRPNKIYTAC